MISSISSKKKQTQVADAVVDCELKQPEVQQLQGTQAVTASETLGGESARLS